MFFNEEVDMVEETSESKLDSNKKDFEGTGTDSTKEGSNWEIPEMPVVKKDADETGSETTETDRNWEYTSLSHDEELVIEDMIDKGELEEPETTTDEPEHRKPLIPTDSGRFEGEVGDSEFYPDDADAQAKIREFGEESVMYRDGYPDFSPFTGHETKWGKVDCQVEIGHMTEHRQNPSFEYGRRPDGASHDPHYDLGNFAQADNELLAKIREDHPDATLDDIEALKKENKLTWHECEDGKTMQLVPTEIHQACKHSGGVSESKYRAEMGDVDRWDY